MSALTNLQARLDRAALAQLREVAASQHAEIERLREQLQHTEQQLRWAEDAAEMWQNACLEAEAALPCGTHMGLTAEGAVVLVEGRTQ